MSDSISPTVSNVMTAIRAFISGVLPVPTGATQVEVLQGLQNRTAMPQGPFVLMTPLGMSRLEWNLHSYTDTEIEITQPIKFDVQLDCYGPSAADWAAMLSTLFFDETACDALELLNDICQPLYVDGPRLMPMIDAEAQYESRWSLTLSLQYNPVTTQLQQSAIETELGLIDVDVKYPVSDISSSHVSIDSSAGT